MDLPSALWQDCEAMRSFALPRRFCTVARRATLTIALATSFLIVPLTDAQTAAKKAQVGVLGITPSVAANHEMFKQGLAQLGYTDGQQIAFVEKNKCVACRLCESVCDKDAIVVPDAPTQLKTYLPDFVVLGTGR